MDRTLRFCMIATFYPPYNFGGDGIFVQRLTHELARRGHQVEVIHCVDSYRLLAGKEPEEPYREHPNVRVHGLRSPAGFLSPLATQQTGFPLFKARGIRRILAAGFDVIHYHNPSLVGGPGLLRMGTATKLYTMHDYWLLCPTHVLFRHNRSACDRPECFACTLHHRRPPQLWRSTGLLRSALREVDLFFAPSRFSQRLHSESELGIQPRHLPNFVPEFEVDGNGSSVRDPETRPCRFLYVGRLEKLKGVQTLLPVFVRRPELELVVAGGGSEAQRLRELARGQQNVRFLGNQDRRQLARLYREATALIVPSLCPEVAPLVIAEAFQHGTPVIARDIGGMPEMVAEGGGAVYGTETELEETLVRVAAEPGWRAAAVERCRRGYREHWSPEVHMARYLGLVEEALRRSGAVPAVGTIR